MGLRTVTERDTMRILLLDDDMYRHKAYRQRLIGSVLTGVETSKECIKVLEESEPFDVVLLDHDLGGKIYVPSGPGTGYEVAEWLRDHPEKMPEVVILHTGNERGAHCMLDVLPNALYKPCIYASDYLSVDYLKSLSKKKPLAQ
jgi:CheY-like chemotaxis protein